MDAKQVRETVDKLFTKRTQFILLCQEIAENFYPERADFSITRQIGDNFADYLTTSYPILCRRDLGDQFGSMLRPTSKTWFHMRPTEELRETTEAKQWLEWAEGVQRRAMYDPSTLFTRATKHADHDYAAFGQAVLSVVVNNRKDKQTLLYQTWHIRDVVWMEGEDGQICLVGRKWKPQARDLDRLFGAKLNPQMREYATRHPLEEVEILHIVMDSDLYDMDAKGKPKVSVYYDCKHEHVIEAVPMWSRHYIIPRWQTVSGSQYAYSPATIAALPDARLIQAMTYTLLEAGEKTVNPPLVATESVVRSDVSMYAGGITWVDAEYDERLGPALRAMQPDSKGLPIGIDMQRDSRALINQAFYLNKLMMPQRGPEMTAYEVSQRIQEYIRTAMPIFEPTEMDYNGALCEETFSLLMRAGAFGSIDAIPKQLQGADIQFRFESPLHDAIEREKGQSWQEARQLIADAMSLDNTAGSIIDAKTALRDCLTGIGVPAKWMRPPEVVDRMIRQDRAQRDAANQMAMLKEGAETATELGNAKQAFAESA